jgi:hypothetical protein
VLLRIPIDFSEELFVRAEESVGGTEAVFATYFDHQYECVVCIIYAAGMSW